MMLTALILTSMMLMLSLLFIVFLVTTQRSGDQRTLSRVMEMVTTQSNLSEATVRGVLQSSNSQSADMTDLVQKVTQVQADTVTQVTKAQTDFLEQVTLGREPMSGELTENEWSKHNGKSEQELLEESLSNVPWPREVQEGLAREAEAIAMMESQRSRQRPSSSPSQPLLSSPPNSQNHSMQPESTSDISSVTINPV